MAFLLAIPAGLFVLNEVGDVIADTLAATAASVQSFGIAVKRKVWDREKVKPAQTKKYSDDYQRIKRKYKS
jgi:hypothetical protein